MPKGNDISMITFPLEVIDFRLLTSVGWARRERKERALGKTYLLGCIYVRERAQLKCTMNMFIM